MLMRAKFQGQRDANRFHSPKTRIPELLPQWPVIFAVVERMRVHSMKRRALLAGALASVFVCVMASAAAADVRITSDPGGEVSSYLRKFHHIRESGERVVIDGPCLSACTLLTAMIPKDHICITSRAVLGFHAASYYDDASRSLVPTRAGSRLVMNLYPPEIRQWIERHGGLTPALIELRGRELASLFQSCH